MKGCRIFVCVLFSLMSMSVAVAYTGESISPLDVAR